jgi:molybdenum cofactor cytidylyltransferase
MTAIILAGGESRRMGQPKALLDADGEGFAQRLARVFSEAGCGVLVVTGAHAAELSAALRGIPLVENANWRAGQLSSVRAGLAAALADPDVDRVLVHPVDIPLVGPGAVGCVASALGQAVAVVPVFRGEPGHPLGLTRAAAEQILGWGDLPHLEAALSRLGATRVEVTDPTILQEVDTPADYEALFGRAAQTR